MPFILLSVESKSCQSIDIYVATFCQPITAIHALHVSVFLQSLFLHDLCFNYVRKDSFVMKLGVCCCFLALLFSLGMDVVSSMSTELANGEPLITLEVSLL